MTMNTKQLAYVLGGILGSLTTVSCDLDIPDLNNPGVGELEQTPTADDISATATGLFIGDRVNKANTLGWVNLLGILGRESYDFDPNDGRFVSEMIKGNLSKSSPFGGSFWLPQYQNIRNANLILDNLDKVTPAYSPEGKAGLQGFAHTMQALEFLTIIVAHDDTGAVIDTDHPIGEPLKPLVSKAAVYTEIYRLLDLAKTELEMVPADGTFAFRVVSGYNPCCNTPAKFLQFNRAIKARATAYQAPTNKALYATVLDAISESFIDDTSTTIDFKFGAYHTFSTAVGDTQNNLFNRNIYAHPSLLTDVHKAADGTTPDDARYLAKITTIDLDGSISASPSLKTTIRFRNLGDRNVQGMILPADVPRMYANDTPVPIIRNEDLILLKAEALWFTDKKTEAVAELNIVRQGSGHLPALAQPADDAAFIAALLYERRYSLLFEGGHRWIDLRRFGIPLPLDKEVDDPPDAKNAEKKHTRNLRFPVPLAECDARPGEAACLIKSSDPAS